MRRNSIIGFAIILVIIAGILIYTTIRSSRAPGTNGIVLPATGYSEHTKYYDIVANYATSTPLLTSTSAIQDAKARSIMYGFIRDTIVTFKIEGNFDNLTSEDIKAIGFNQDRKARLQITYITVSSPRTISYIFTTYIDTLGAHGNTFFKTFTFNSKTGAALSLADIFLSGAAYLDTLSSLARAKLPGIIGKSADTTFIKNGTTPADKSFEDFFFDNKELVILFAPYAVAPYTAGPQTLRIPLSELSSILKPEYR